MVTPHDIFCVTTQKRRVCTEYKLVSGRIQQWLLIEETLLECEDMMKSCALSVCWWGGGGGGRKVTFSTLLHTISLMQPRSSSADVIQRVYINRSSSSSSSHEPWSSTVSGWIGNFPHFPHLSRQTQRPKGFFPPALKFICKSGYSSRPVTIPQDST